MQHRDKVLLEKIISEIDIAARIMGTRIAALVLEHSGGFSCALIAAIKRNSGRPA